MAEARLDTQMKILKEANERVDELVSAILQEAEITGEVVDVTKMSKLNQIINRLETMQFRGNVDLLKQTVAVYDKAIKAIDEQLESEEIKDFEQYSIESLEKAKELLKKQSKDGRVGTAISKFEELSKAETSGELEKAYNDTKIEELNYTIEEKENEENARVTPFNKIISETRKSRETLARYKAIFEEIAQIDAKIKKLEAELAKTGITDEDKQKKKDEIKKLKADKIKAFQKCKKDEKDKTFDFDKDKEKLEDYFKRVKDELDIKIRDARLSVINDLNNIKDLEVDLGTGKKKVSEYLKDYMTVAKFTNVDKLTQKLAIDKDMLRKAIQKSDEHKEVEELKNQRKVYEDRNQNLNPDSTRNPDGNNPTRTGQNSVVPYKPKMFEWFNWKHPVKSIVDWVRHGNNKKNTQQQQQQTIARENQDKFILKQIEKELDPKNFRKQYTVEEQDRITSKVTYTLNEKREQFYREQNEQDER